MLTKIGERKGIKWQVRSGPHRGRILLIAIWLRGYRENPRYDFEAHFQFEPSWVGKASTPMSVDLELVDERTRIHDMVKENVDELIQSIDASKARTGDSLIREPEHKNGKIVLTYGRR